MNSIETPLDPTLLQQRADLARDRLATLGYWRDHLAELDLVVAELKEIAAENWYVAAQAWRTARSDAPLPAFLDPRTDKAFELRLKWPSGESFLKGSVSKPSRHSSTFSRSRRASRRLLRFRPRTTPTRRKQRTNRSNPSPSTLATAIWNDCAASVRWIASGRKPCCGNEATSTSRAIQRN